MGNILVSLINSIPPYSIQGISVTLTWFFAVIYVIFKLIIEKPWGATAIHRKQIVKNEKDRKNRFMAVRKRLRPSNENVDKERYRILEMPLLQLKDALQNEDISAEDALDAYVWKAFDVHERLNCAAEFLIEAFDEAKVLDDTWRGNRSKPPLFGIPFSVKGSFYMKGYDCCMGLAKYLFQPMENDCTFVTHLRSLGAVPFVYTNVPQGLLSYVCSNPIYGTTGNPFNVDRTPGGSSGGETALCAAGGCAFGIGSDLAGSLRIPASMCGITTLKPTEARFVVKHAFTGLPGKGRIALAYGYFTKSVEEQIFLLKNTYGCEAYRSMVPKMVPLHLNIERINETKKKKLRIGYFVTDGYLKPVPACSRVVVETAEKLKKLGHELVVFEVPDPNQAAALFYKNLMPDRGALYNSLYAHEVLSPHIKMFAAMLRVPMSLRWLAGFLLQWFSPQMSILCSSYMKNLSDLRSTQQQTDEYIEKFTKQWKEMGLDVLICPAFTGLLHPDLILTSMKLRSFEVPPVPHSYPTRLNFCALATALFNMLDFPAGVVPTGFVTEEDDAKLASEDTWPTGSNMALKLMRNAASNSVNMPLAVQIVGLPFYEEDVLAVMHVVEKLW